MRFFTPLPNFMPWLKAETKKNKRPIIDCGCGDGDLLREMRKANLPALGVDPRYSWGDERVGIDIMSMVLAMQAEDCCMVRDTPCLLLVCRPCHSGFPINIHRVMAKGSDLYYVGLERNVDQDLGDLEYTKVIDVPVGEEDEYLYKVG